MMTELATKQLEAFLKNEDPTFPVFVGVQRIERSYGGPEEGGWYYDSSRSYQHIRWVKNREEFEKHVREVFEEFGLRWSAHNPDRTPNNWDNGDELSLVYRWGSDFPEPKFYPRPQYE